MMWNSSSSKGSKQSKCSSRKMQFYSPNLPTEWKYSCSGKSNHLSKQHLRQYQLPRIMCTWRKLSVKSNNLQHGLDTTVWQFSVQKYCTCRCYWYWNLTAMGVWANLACLCMCLQAYHMYCISPKLLCSFKVLLFSKHTNRRQKVP